MAKKRLNKKLLIIGFVIMVIIAVIGITFLLMTGKDPQKFIDDAQIALEQNDFKAADKAYKQAFGAANKNIDLQIEILFKMVDMHLTEAENIEGEMHEKNWPKARGAWKKIVELDNDNIEARTELLDFIYIIAENGGNSMWKEVRDQAAELIEVYEEKGQKPDPFAVLAKGKANLKIAEFGQTPNPEEVLEEAREDLEVARKLDPKNEEIYILLSDAEKVQGRIDESRGISDAAKIAVENAQEILNEGLEVIPDSPELHARILLTEAVQEDVDREQIKKDFQELINKFSDSAHINFVTAQYYSRYFEDFDPIIENLRQAVQKDPENADYRISLANTLYQNYLTTGEMKYLEESIKVAKKALELPGSQETTGPTQLASRRRRLRIYSALANHYLEKALKAPPESEQRNQNITEVDKYAHEIEQLLGTKDSLDVAKWNALIEYAKGNEVQAIKTLYNVYEEIKATDLRDPQLSIRMAEIFASRSEAGLHMVYLVDAIRNGIKSVKSEMLLDYAQRAIQFRDYDGAASAVESYENFYSESDRSVKLKAAAYVQSGQLDKAQEAIDEIQDDQFEKILRQYELLIRRIRQEVGEQTAEMDQQDVVQRGNIASDIQNEVFNKYKDQLNDLIIKAMEMAPERLPFNYLLTQCNSYVLEGQTEKAKQMIDKYIQAVPDNLSAITYKLRLEEPNPLQIEIDRMQEIVLKALEQIDDPLKRYQAEAQYYRNSNETEKAIEILEEAYSEYPENEKVISDLFNFAVIEGKMELAQELAEKARKANIDSCNGKVFQARIHIKNQQYQKALNAINESLEQRPVYQYGYMLKSQILQELGKTEEALAAARDAVKINPTNSDSSRQLAILLYNKYMNSGASPATDLFVETERTLRMAMANNPGQWQLQAMYARFVQDNDPQRALSIMQGVAENSISPQATLSYGQMAAEMAQKEIDPDKKQHLFDIAGQALKKAYSQMPENPQAVDAYSEYLRLTGQSTQVEQAFADRPDVMWKIYLRNNQNQKAKELIEQLLEKNPADTSLIRGLMMAERNLGNADQVAQLSDKLVEIEESPENRALQVQLLIETSQIEMAEKKMQSFKERYPDNQLVDMLNAWVTLRQGKIEQGKEIVLKVLEKQPENAQAWRLLGQANNILGETEQAIDAYNKSISFSQDNNQIKLELAKTYLRADRRIEAISRLKELVNNDQAPRQSLTLLESLYKQEKRDFELKNYYKQLIKRYPDDPFWYYRTALYLAEQDNYTAALPLIEKAWELLDSKENSFRLYDFYVDVLKNAGRKDEFYQLTTKHIDTPLAPVAYTHLAQDQAELGSRSKAQDYYLNALEKAGTNDTFIYNILNNMIKYLGNAAAENWCRKTLDKNPDSISVNLIMYEMTNMKKQYNQAITYIDKCIELVNPNGNLYLDYLLKKSNTLIAAHVNTNDKTYFNRAIENLEKILEIQPKNTTVLNNLAFLLAEDGQIELALEYGKRACEAQPNNANNMDTYAFALIKSEQYEEALKTLQKAIQILEDKQEQDIATLWQAYEHLGMAKEGLGDINGAVQAYKKAISVGGEVIPEAQKQEINKQIQNVML